MLARLHLRRVRSLFLGPLDKSDPRQYLVIVVHDRSLRRERGMPEPMTRWRTNRMSAYIVGKSHIDALVTAGLTHGRPHGPLHFYAAGVQYQLDYTNADAIGTMLWAENIKSVWARYPNDTRETLPGPIDTPEPDSYLHRMRRLPSHVAVLKAIRCYEYQSCEHGEEWEASPARAFCEALRLAVIASLPGYDDAEWEVTGAVGATA